MNPLTWPAFIIGLGLEGISGSNPFIIGMIGLLVFALALFRANVSLPTAAFLSTLAMGGLAAFYDFKSEISPEKTGPFSMLYILIIVMGGFMIVNALYKRVAQA